VYTEPGKGTTFKVYFPRYGGIDAPVIAARTKEKPLHGTETIMVVEDETQVRDLAANMLRHYGYKVLEAHDGVNAQAVLGGYEGAVDLLVTDVILPDMNGRMVYEQLSTIRKGLRVLFKSG
jgi:DNA-binding NtrC family response regulator